MIAHHQEIVLMVRNLPPSTSADDSSNLFGAASRRTEMFLKKCICFPPRSPRLQGDVLLIGGAAAIRAGIQTCRVLSPEFWLSMTERISEQPRCQMGDCSFMGIVCKTPRNMSALSALKHTKRFCGAEAAASPICAAERCISVLQHPARAAEKTALI